LYYMYIISALAVHDLMAEMLDSSQFDIKIKWPNDILVNSKKIAGILNENFLNSMIANTSVVGIGININQEDFRGLQNVTSLKMMDSKEHDSSLVLRALNRHLENYYLKLKGQNYETLLKKYYAHFFKIGELQLFIMNDQEKEFIVKGINEKGLLNLTDKSGKEHYFDIKEIKWAL